MAKKPILDSVFGKFVSRKFLVFIVATALMLLTKTFKSSDWAWIAMVYIGTQGAVDIAERMLAAGGKNGNITGSVTSIVNQILKDPKSVLNRNTKEQPTTDEATDPDKTDGK